VKEELLNECGLWEPSSPEMDQKIKTILHYDFLSAYHRELPR
jgi:hypothetical protein